MDVDGTEEEVVAIVDGEPDTPKPIRKLTADVVNQIAAAEVSRQGHLHFRD